MRKLLLSVALTVGSTMAQASEYLNVFTWDGYVLPDEVAAVNDLLKEQGYDIEVRVLDTLAEGPEQMFDVMRSGDVDVSFLTLNYINMEGFPFSNLLQPIDTSSPRLSNAEALLPELSAIEMGMSDAGPLYLPFGGGAYGIWANDDAVAQHPSSVSELLKPEWKGRISLTSGQVQPNVALALMAMGQPPFQVQEASGDRAAMAAFSKADGELQKTLNALYDQVGFFWSAGPEFRDDLAFVASYGPGASAHVANGGNWSIVNFDEGNTVWLDTINFSKTLSGKKLEAAEIFANYFIGKDVQERIVNELGMVAATTSVAANPMLDANPEFFAQELFWPPYTKVANNVMNMLSKRASGDH
ncbi:PotD/PotF family extracellular solute-binding protein [Phaeobacter sp. HF9A]|uniref:ABC transporter substrate-binding protein n=1 Tax=Phaeobacter sp. HF9A TaxID=2721561 RepID=UPI00143125D4|nr:PotD/PotF family extracellular solute-binding protein [Phaeobacter sp. HF9A]NIZ13589.1 extracellular solute-binding protein [Phaeobacter sp. HF9A]